MVVVSAPGKLVLSGEWSVLEGKPCIILALDKKVTVEAKEITEKGIIINAPDFAIKKIQAKFDGEKVSIEATDKQKELLGLVTNAIQATLKYLNEKKVSLKNFELTTHSEETAVEINKKRTKLGFGSSAAVVVSTIGAVLSLHGQGITTHEEKEQIFKLGVIAHYFAQGKIGSSFDVAISTFGGVTLYYKPDMKWVSEQLQKQKLAELVAMSWPNLRVENISLPKKLNLSVGFVGYSASTKELIKKLEPFKLQAEYKKIIDEIGETTGKIAEALEEQHDSAILSLIKKNRTLLKQLSEKSGVGMETKELNLLANIADKNGGAGKFSGAGGGDCGIAISFDAQTKQKIEEEWERNNIMPVKVRIAEKGVC